MATDDLGERTLIGKSQLVLDGALAGSATSATRPKRPTTSRHHSPVRRKRNRPGRVRRTGPAGPQG